MRIDDRLTCEEFFRDLEAQVDGEVPQAARIRAARHLDECDECAREHRFERRLWVEFKNVLRAIRAPDGLRHRISRHLMAIAQTS
jgi:anti-sigma factor (TIGR02949 family)